jgi:hypothetical protein
LFFKFSKWPTRIYREKQRNTKECRNLVMGTEQQILTSSREEKTFVSIPKEKVFRVENAREAAAFQEKGDTERWEYLSESSRHKGTLGVLDHSMFLSVPLISTRVRITGYDCSLKITFG